MYLLLLKAQHILKIEILNGIFLLKYIMLMITIDKLCT